MAARTSIDRDARRRRRRRRIIFRATATHVGLVGLRLRGFGPRDCCKSPRRAERSAAIRHGVTTIWLRSRSRSARELRRLTRSRLGRRQQRQQREPCASRLSVRGLAFGSWQREPPPAAPAPVATPPALPAPAAPAAAPTQASDSSEEYDFVHVVLDSDDEPDAAAADDRRKLRSVLGDDDDCNGNEDYAGPSSSNSDCQIVGGRTLEERNAELLENAVDLDADDESPSRDWLAARRRVGVAGVVSGVARRRATRAAAPSRRAATTSSLRGRFERRPVRPHQRCLAPPLRTIPADAWHCPRCVEARRAGSWRGAAHDCMPEGRTRPPRIGRCFQVSQSQLASPQAPMPAAAASSPDPREGRPRGGAGQSSANAATTSGGATPTTRAVREN